METGIARCHLSCINEHAFLVDTYNWFNAFFDRNPPKSKCIYFVSHFQPVILNNQKNQLFIPRDFEHVFLSLSEHAIVSYKVDNYYNDEFDSGTRYYEKT